jgi:hypothetical protein
LSASFAGGEQGWSGVHQLEGNAVMQDDSELIDELDALERSLNHIAHLAHVFGSGDEAKTLSHTAMQPGVSVNLSQLAEAA